MDRFRIAGQVCIITGGAGFLGLKHAEAVFDAGGLPVILDNSDEKLQAAMDHFPEEKAKYMRFAKCDITSEESLIKVKDLVLDGIKDGFGSINALINNAANNQAVTNSGRLESFPVEAWDADLNVGLKGAFLCAKVFGSHMAATGGGVIVNVSSDLGLIAPDQRIYRKEDVEDDKQPTKPITYSVVKHALIGMTKYLATYWADKNVRVNAICPGGVFNGHDRKFVEGLTDLIPLGRMAHEDEYKAAIVFLLSRASSYMTGANLVIDGGRTCW